MRQRRRPLYREESVPYGGEFRFYLGNSDACCSLCHFKARAREAAPEAKLLIMLSKLVPDAQNLDIPPGTNQYSSKKRKMQAVLQISGSEQQNSPFCELHVLGLDSRQGVPLPDGLNHG